MKNKYLILSLVVLSVPMMVASCGEKPKNKEQSILFHDDFLRNYVVSRLNKKGMEYRVEGKSVWYLIEDRNGVKRIYEDALLNRPIEYKFFDVEKQKKFVRLLEAKGVSPLVKSDTGGGVYVYIPKKSRIVAERVFNKIIKN